MKTQSSHQTPLLLAVTLLLAGPTLARPQDSDSFTALFNGHDLSGWVPVNTAPETWQVRDGMIVCSGKPRGFMRTDRMYENYILELEWRHTKERGNAGVMVHADGLPQVGAPYPQSVEVQVMDGDAGSMFGIRGCFLKPITNPSGSAARPTAKATEDRTHPAGQWNHYRLKSEGGNLELAVNGKVVTKAVDSTQVKGYICLESENSEVHFRNIRIKEMPSSNPPKEKVARDQVGYASLFNGLNFEGWMNHEKLGGRWTAHDGMIKFDPGQPIEGKRQDSIPWTEGAYKGFDLIVDWRLTSRPVPKQMNDFEPHGLFKRTPDGKVATHEINFAGDSGVFLRGDQKAQVNIWSQPMGSGDINPYHKDAKLSPEIRKATMPSEHADNRPGQWNRFEISMREDRVTVKLNGKTVIHDAELPGVRSEGPIGLQDHGDPIEFRNLFIRVPGPGGGNR